MSEEAVAIEKPRLLVVEDSATMRMALKRILREEYDIVEAADGQIGWDLLQKDENICAVFSDLMMPHKDGFELLQDIRNADNRRIQELPVIIITGAEDDDTKRQQALDAGASDFITKPFDSLQLRARARVHVRVGPPVAPPPLDSTIDAATSLPNRQYLERNGPQKLAAAISQGVELSLLRIDLDAFEELVRKRGRRVADKIIQFIVKLLQNGTRTEDTIFRLDTDKFGILMFGCGHDAALEASKRIHQRAIKTGFQIGNDRFTISASAALVTPKSGLHLSFDELRKRCDDLLQEAVGAGGNRLLSDIIQETADIAQDPLPTMGLDEAIDLLRIGDRQSVDKVLPGLLRKMLPLLERADLQLGLNCGFLLQQIRKNIGTR